MQFHTYYRRKHSPKLNNSHRIAHIPFFDTSFARQKKNTPQNNHIRKHPLNLERDQSTTPHNQTNIMGKKKQIMNQNTTIKAYYNTKITKNTFCPNRNCRGKQERPWQPLATPLNSIIK